MSARRSAPRRGIVLGGGGVLGAAWMIGALSALRDVQEPTCDDPLVAEHVHWALEVHGG